QIFLLDGCPDLRNEEPHDNEHYHNEEQRSNDVSGLVTECGNKESFSHCTKGNRCDEKDQPNGECQEVSGLFLHGNRGRIQDTDNESKTFSDPQTEKPRRDISSGLSM